MRIATGRVELAPGTVVSATTYNGQFPGPLLRFAEGCPVVVDVHNDTAAPELLHWHGQRIPADVDGAAEEGTPYIPAHGMRRLAFIPGPAGFRFYHTHVAAHGDLTGVRTPDRRARSTSSRKPTPGRTTRKSSWC